MIILKILLSLLLYLGIPTLLVLIVTGLGAVPATGLGELIALPFLLFLYEKEQRRRQHFTYAPRFLKDKAPLLVIALGAASCIGLNGLLTLSRLDLLFPAFSQEVAAELYAPPLPLQLLFLVFIIPPVEELVFRGTIFALIRERFSWMTAAAVSSLLFALFHGNVVQGIYALCLGFLCAWLYEKIHGLYASLVLHMSANLVSVIISALTGSLEFLNSLPAQLILTLLALGGAIWCIGRLKRLTEPRAYRIFHLF